MKSFFVFLTIHFLFTLKILISKNHLKSSRSFKESYTNNIKSKNLNLSTDSSNNLKKSIHPLKIEVLIESLCPDCIAFFENAIAPFIEVKNYSDIANVILYPYGNAKTKYDNETGKYVFTCQHGPNECYGNLIQTCIIKKQPNLHTTFQLLTCIYENIRTMQKNFDKTLENCVNEKINDNSSKSFIEEIYNCVNSKEGNDYMYEMSQKYKEHKHVPWIVVNGERTKDMEKKAHDNLLKFACEYAENNINSCKNLKNNEYSWEKFDYTFIQHKDDFCVNNYFN